MIVSMPTGILPNYYGVFELEFCPPTHWLRDHLSDLAFFAHSLSSKASYRTVCLVFYYVLLCLVTRCGNSPTDLARNSGFAIYHQFTSFPGHFCHCTLERNYFINFDLQTTSSRVSSFSDCTVLCLHFFKHPIWEREIQNSLSAIFCKNKISACGGIAGAGYRFDFF